MNELFSSLTRAIEGAPTIAMSAALVWGILSVVLSPCHLASIPLIVGFIDQQGRMTPRRAFVISLLFALGILLTIGVIGGVTALAGRMMGDVGPWANYAVAVIFLGVGLHLLEAIHIPLPQAVQPGIRRKGAWAAFVLGLVFGIALGPCTFAYMAPMLAITFRLSATTWLYGVTLLVLYGIGHCGVIVLAGTCTGWVQRYLDWNEASRGSAVLKKICGALVVLGGFWLLYTA